MKNLYFLKNKIQPNIINILTISIILILIQLFNNDSIEIELFGSCLISTLTIHLSIIKQNLEKDKVFKELFIEFNSRYNKELNDLFNEIRILKDQGIEKQFKEREILLIEDYFNLCSEEYLWYSKGRIPLKVWQAWESGIVENLKLKEVFEIFESETNTVGKRKSFYGFAEFINNKIKKTIA